MAENRNVTYILRCSDGTLYTGWTNNIEKRLEAHNAGKGGKYTRVRVPVELVYMEEYDTKQEAMSREAKIKRLSRNQKEALIGGGNAGREEEARNGGNAGREEEARNGGNAGAGGRGAKRRECP